jgi:hypothetical protein
MDSISSIFTANESVEKADFEKTSSSAAINHLHPFTKSARAGE